MVEAEKSAREKLVSARRVVVKVGTRVLVKSSGRPDKKQLQALVKSIAALLADGKEVVLVSSGAVGAGMETLSLAKRPSTLPLLQMAAAVGQPQLLSLYSALFKKYKRNVAQILLTPENLSNRERHLNARNTLEQLLQNGIVPIVNENDVIATDEIRFSDNDSLASLVALLIDADALVMLTTTNGLRAITESGSSRRIPFVERVTQKTFRHVRGGAQPLSRGGMQTKLDAAKTASDCGVLTVIADGRKPVVLEQAMSGKSVGTLLGNGERRKGYPAKKRWLAFFTRAEGAVIVNKRAEEAICVHGKSLLPVGITNCEGSFSIGSLVNIKSESGAIIARGLVEYSTPDVEKIKGHRTSEIPKLLGAKTYDEVIHRDNMVIID